MFRRDSRNLYLARSLETIPWIQHAFGTRLATGWPPETETLVTLRQVHSDRVLEAQAAGCAGEADALITNRPGLPLSIRTADCLPILIADFRTRSIAAVHAGWRGTLLGVLPKTVQAMAERFGTRMEDLSIAAGPAIGPCCFEVGPEVARQFRHLFPERTDLDRQTTIDLAEANRRQLRHIGVSDAQFVPCPDCTFCNPDTFHSYRRDRDASGRMVSAIGILPPRG